MHMALLIEINARIIINNFFVVSDKYALFDPPVMALFRILTRTYSYFVVYDQRREKSMISATLKFTIPSASFVRTHK